MKILLILLLSFNVFADDNLKLVYSEPVQVSNLSELREIYTFREFHNITTIHFNKESIEYNYFIENVLLLNFNSYERILEMKKTNGYINTHTIIYVSNSQDVLNIIEQTPNSIGYINNQLFIRDNFHNVKVIDFSNFIF